MKDTFTACGIRFDTQSAINGFVRLNSGEAIEAWRIDGPEADHFAGKIFDDKHPDLAKRFETLKSKFELDNNPTLLLSNYGFPAVMAAGDKVIMDATALSLLTPDEANAICAHELAHIECKHTHNDTDQHTIEREADRIAKDRLGGSEALCSALEKLGEFNDKLSEASFRFKALMVGKTIFHKAHETLGGIPKGHPPMQERIARLR